jgi:hydroxypyruvate reductase
MNQKKSRVVLKALYEAALAGVDPSRAVSRALEIPRVWRLLRGSRGTGVFACGKAAAAMAAGLPEDLRRSALVVLPRGYPAAGLESSEVLFSSHPEPDRASVAATRRALSYFAEFGSAELILCLVSGGASSLLTMPRAGVTLEQKRRAVRRLMRSGASIVEINRLRKRLSAVKGGKLGRATSARLVTLVLSDVPGDDPALVGSGPTIRGDPEDVTLVVGSNRLGLDGAAHSAAARGLRPRRIREWISGEASEQGERLARKALRLGRGEVLLAGGETTVAIGRGRLTGRGGRNLELALGAAFELDGSPGAAILAAGSDGVDGSARAAGAFADATTIARAGGLHLDPGRSLARHDTERFFESLGDLFVTGPTGTNVCDWVFAVADL